MKVVRIAIIGVLIAAGHAATASAEVCRWTGGGGANWSSPQNWETCRGGVPLNNDSVVFPAGRPNAASVNDLTGLVLGGLQILGLGAGGADYDIAGQALRLTGPLSAEMPDNQSEARIRAKITLGAAIVVSNNHPAALTSVTLDAVDLGGFTLTVDSSSALQINTLSGSGALTRQGRGLLSLGASTYAGPTTVKAGNLLVLTSESLGASAGANDATEVQAGGHLALSRNVTLSETLVLAGDGRDSPSSTIQGALMAASGTATITGDVVLTADTTVSVQPNAQLVFVGPVRGTTLPIVLSKQGAGTLALRSLANAWDRLVVFQGTVRLDADNVLPDTSDLVLGLSGVLDMQGHDDAFAELNGLFNSRVLLGGGRLVVAEGSYIGTIEGAGELVKSASGALVLGGTNANTFTGTLTVAGGTVSLEKASGKDATRGAIQVNGGELITRSADQIPDDVMVTIQTAGRWTLLARETIGSLWGRGVVSLQANPPTAGGALTINVATTSPFEGRIEGASSEPVAKTGIGRLILGGQNTVAANVRVTEGTLEVNGSLAAETSVLVDAGTLNGSGRVGHITGSSGAASGRVNPTPGRTLSGTSAILSGSFDVQLTNAGPTQLRLTGSLTLRGARLVATRSGTLAVGSTFTIVSAGQPIIGTFSGLPQGAELGAFGQRLKIDYAGGSGNDIVLTVMEGPPPQTYFLAEGSTGPFFDEDVVLANPGTVAAPIVMTFLKENGQQVVVPRTLAPQSQVIVHVDEIPGLEGAASSVRIDSPTGQELFVERTMFWGPSRYAGHTGSALQQPSNDWFFAEGAQGFFDTFVLLVNPNPNPVDATLTFLRERGGPVTKTVTIGANARRTVGASEYQELASQAFGIRVHATEPIMAERSMYFASTPDRLWGGGHESAGITEPYPQWFLAEGSTGDFFDTFILLSNPQSTPAQVSMRYLLWTGESIDVTKTIPANGRLTVNPETEPDQRLKNTAFSTRIESDVPIIVERSMYWPGATRPWGEAHNSVAFKEPHHLWGLAEGRLGGDETPFSTYILLANPAPVPSQVEVTFLRDGAAPIVKTYTVPATGRFTIDTSAIPELHDSTFGASIRVTNDVGIVVERSMYWDANGIFWSGGTNAPGILRPLFP